MKIRELNDKDKKNYFAKKMMEWRKNNKLKDLKNKKIWRDNNKEKRKIYEKEYLKKNGQLIRENKRKKYKDNPIKQNKNYINNYLKEYLKDEKNHKKYLIRQRDNYKFRKELLKKYGKCILCGSQKRLEIHHESYEEDKRNLLILCMNCHKMIHRKDNKTEVIQNDKT